MQQQRASRYNFRRNTPLADSNSTTNSNVKKPPAKSKPEEQLKETPSLATTLESTVSNLLANKCAASAIRFAKLVPHLSGEVSTKMSVQYMTIANLYYDMHQYRRALHLITQHKLHLESVQALFIAARCHVCLSLLYIISLKRCRSILKSTNKRSIFSIQNAKMSNSLAP
jgi:hypothetical protein